MLPRPVLSPQPRGRGELLWSCATFATLTPVSEQLVTTSSLYNVDLHSNKPDQADERGHCAHEARRETLRDSLLQKQGSLLEKQSVSDHTYCQQQLAGLLSSFQGERHRRGTTNSHCLRQCVQRSGSKKGGPGEGIFH